MQRNAFRYPCGVLPMQRNAFRYPCGVLPMQRSTFRDPCEVLPTPSAGLPTDCHVRENAILFMLKHTNVMPNQIKTFGMSRLTIGSCSEFHTQVNQFITTATPAALHIENEAASYAQAVDALAAIVNRQRSYISTAALSDADEVRDRATGVIVNVIRAYENTPVDEKRQAARLLSPQLSAYKGIGKHEYTKQTAETRGMLAVLADEDNATALATLGLTEEVSALSEANAAFEQSFQTRTAEVSTRMAQSDVKSEDAVNLVNAIYESIVTVVNAYAVVQPTEAINTFINDVNGVVGTFSQIAGSRAKGSATSGGNTSTSGGGSTKPPVSGGGDDSDNDHELG